jgi:hypothetical protein
MISAGLAAVGAFGARATARLGIAANFSATGALGANAIAVAAPGANAIAAGMAASGSFGADAQILRFIPRLDIEVFITAYGGDSFISGYHGDLQESDEDDGDVFIRTAAA